MANEQTGKYERRRQFGYLAFCDSNFGEGGGCFKLGFLSYFCYNIKKKDVPVTQDKTYALFYAILLLV